ncbi:MAG: M28 family metallopeptidase [Clostridium sp.]|nr:M28 family metallopeptidase [Clostridium sp.]
MKKKLIYFPLLSITSFLLLFTICLNNTYSPFSSSNVLSNIYVLSSDTLAGRLAGSTENSMTGSIIKNRFTDSGLTTLNDDGNYFQDFNTICPVITNTSPYLKIESSGEIEEELKYGVDFKEDMINFKNNTFTFSKADKVNSYLSYMEVTCSDGQFLIYVPKDNNFSFRSSFFSDFAKDAVIMVSNSAFEKISNSLNEGKDISIHIPFNEEEKTISNIVGIIKGSNPSLAPFVLTAHYDHLGKDGLGNTYSGALDNASGASFLLELSRSLSTYGKPERDIIFVALNAEEFGLLGSKAFAEANFFDIQDSKVINFDMIGSADYPISFMQGSKFKNTNSELLSSLKELCESNNVSYEVLYEDSSDHASFNNLNIDAVSFCHSDKTRIHTPSDTIDYIDSDAIDVVYSIVDKEIKDSCYSVFTRFVYSSQSLLLISIILIILIAWGLFDKSKIITDKKGSIFFTIISLISVITSCIFYAKGYSHSIIVTLIFGFSIIIISIKNFKLISK